MIKLMHMNSAEERNRALMLFAYNFLATSIMVMGRIVRDTLFLNKYKGDRLMLSLMYIGVAIIVSTATFFYTKRSSFYRLDKLIQGTFSIGITLLLVFIALVSADVTPAYSILYIFIELLGAFMMFQFWSFTNELLDSREAKRILGLVGGGGIVASIIVGSSVGKLVKLLGGRVQFLLFINAFFMLCCILIVRHMGKKYRLRLQRGVIAKTVSAKQAEVTSQISITRTPYVKYIAIMTGLIYLVTTLVDYQFKIVASDKITDPQQLASYFGFIYSIFGGIFSLVFQFFATSRLLKYSIFMSLGILPAVLTIGSIFYIVLPADWVMFTYAGISFVAPLVAITMAKSGDSAFRYTINDAAIQLLYIPLDARIKSRTKALIDGMVKPTFIGISGLILFAISYMGRQGLINSDVKLISWIVTLVGCIWILTIIRIRGRYLAVLIDNIKKKRFGSNQLTVQSGIIQSIIERAIESGEDEEVAMAIDMVESSGTFKLGHKFVPLLTKASPKIKVKILALLRSMESRFYTYDVLQLLSSENEEVLCEAILTYGYMQTEKSIKLLAAFLDSENVHVRRAAVISLIKFAGISGVITAGNHLSSMIASDNEIDRASAAYILGEIGQKNMDQHLFALLNDKSVAVRREAVFAATKIDSNIFIPKLFYMLFDRSVSFDVEKVLSKLGDRILVPAEDILNNNLESNRLKIEVAKLLGDIRSHKALALLWQTLNSRSDEIRTIALNSMKKLINDFQDFSIDKGELKKLLLKEISQYFQILYSSVTVKKAFKTHHLWDVVDRKLQNCFQRIFSILSLMYGNSLFDNIYFNLTQKFVSNVQRSNALEIVDNIVDKEIRPIIVPLIESSNDEERLKLGYSFFNIKKIQVADIIDEFLLDDSEWVRSITLYVIAHENFVEIYDRIEIFLYDPSPTVREAALYAMNYLHLRIAGDDKASLLNDFDNSLRLYAAEVFQEN